MFVYEIEQLSFSYDAKFSLKAEQVLIEEGVTCLKGPMGSGKTTLLLNLAFLLKGRWRSFKFFGEDVNDDNFEFFRKIVTYVPQSPILLRRTVFDNIAYPLILRGENKRQIAHRVLRIAENLRINDLLEKRADQLSGGQAKLVCIARACVFNPKVLLLDEPTANLDEVGKRILYDFLNAIVKDTSIIIVSHDEEMFESLPCGSVLQVKEGRVVKL